MINHLHIENFKSIRHLDLDCRKINIFIGEPNAGKSNIIEALSLYSIDPTKKLNAYIRFKDLSDFFPDNNINVQLKIGIDQSELSCLFNSSDSFLFNIKSDGQSVSSCNVDLNGAGFSLSNNLGLLFYRFNSLVQFNSSIFGKLISPYGENLVSILLSNPELKKSISDLLRSLGFRLNIKPVEKDLLISKEVNNDIFSYSFNNVSETLKRIIFFMACLETNQNATLLFDEPEANTFPFYTKYLAERIALDETNQYFFTTHNPYLLRSVVEKANKKDLRVIITYMENYETKIRVLNDDELNEILDNDIFFNLDLFIKDAADS